MDERSDLRNCPYCGIAFSIEGVDASHHPINLQGPLTTLAGKRPESLPDSEVNKTYTLTSHRCPSCKRPILWVNILHHASRGIGQTVRTVLVYPKGTEKPVAGEIPENYRRDVREAHSILTLSPRASAALSRRSVQAVLRDKEGVHETTLYAEIKIVLESGHLPPYLARDLDAIRNVGNFGAHPIKDAHTGEIVDVEAGEAEWTLQVLEALLMFYFVDAERSKQRREDINKKLKAAGKKPLLE